MQMESSAPPLEGGSTDSTGDAAVFGVVTVSDRASAGVYNDESGPAVLRFFGEAINSRWLRVPLAISLLSLTNWFQHSCSLRL